MRSKWMDILRKITDHKVAEAIKKGHLDRLPGRGKPLKLDK